MFTIIIKKKLKDKHHLVGSVQPDHTPIEITTNPKDLQFALVTPQTSSDFDAPVESRTKFSLDDRVNWFNGSREHTAKPMLPYAVTTMSTTILK